MSHRSSVWAPPGVPHFASATENEFSGRRFYFGSEFKGFASKVSCSRKLSHQPSVSLGSCLPTLVLVIIPHLTPSFTCCSAAQYSSYGRSVGIGRRLGMAAMHVFQPRTLGWASSADLLAAAHAALGFMDKASGCIKI